MANEYPVRVLHVIHGMDCGGAENMIMNLYRSIDKTRIQFDFLVHTQRDCFFDEEIVSLGGRIFRAPYFNGINYIHYKKSLNELFEAHPEIRIVHGHLGSCANIYLGIAKRHGCYTIAHSHSTKPEFSFKNMIYRLNTYDTRRIADYFFGCGKESGEYRFGKRITKNKEKYSILNNAIDSDKYVFNENTRKRIKEELGVEDSIVVGHVGRFDYPKNHSFLVDIGKVLVSKDERITLMLVGDGKLKQEIQEKVNQIGLSENVIFTGIRKDVPDVMQAMDCFLFPSHYEGLPVTVIEAQAAGLPCILSDTITSEVKITDLVHYVSLDESPEVWAEKVMESIKTNDRANTKSYICGAGYDIKTTANWLVDFYLEKLEHQM